MDIQKFTKSGDCQWLVQPYGDMRVPVVIFGDEKLLEAMDDKVLEQATNVSKLPGIVKASYAMPDAHYGYGFPIGGVAAFDPEKGGIISAGGVGFDISCGVRMLSTGLKKSDLEPKKRQLADMLARHIPAGLGGEGKIKLPISEIDDMLTGGAEWAVERGYGRREDLLRTEENGKMAGARCEYVSDHAKQRQRDQLGTLGSGNHYIEVQCVIEVYDTDIAKVFGIAADDIFVSVHCGSRGLGHQIGTDYLPKMIKAAQSECVKLPERELACAPINSEVGKKYFGAMNAGVNSALANRQVLTHLVREVIGGVFPRADARLLYDVSHNICKIEEHKVKGEMKHLYVHRKGATRSFGPGHKSLPQDFRVVGQPVLIGGTMGTASYVLTGTEKGAEIAFSSCCHGAGRAMSRKQASKRWHGNDVIRTLAGKNIIIKGASRKGIAEEAPHAYKDVDAVVSATELAGLGQRVAKLEPMICVKG